MEFIYFPGKFKLDSRSMHLNFSSKTNTIPWYVLSFCLDSMSKQFHKYFPIHSRALLKHLNVILGIQIGIHKTHIPAHQHLLAHASRHEQIRVADYQRKSTSVVRSKCFCSIVNISYRILTKTSVKLVFFKNNCISCKF